jgi:hypothetical protein
LEDAARRLSVYKYFFIFGQILHGIGAAPLITLVSNFFIPLLVKLAAAVAISAYSLLFFI